MKKLKNTDDVIAYLKNRFKGVSDLDLYVSRGYCISGGFYWMNYLGRPEGLYPFHETWVRLSDYQDMASLAEAAEQRIIRQLQWQKECDQDYAKNFSKEVSYRYDYQSLGVN